MSPERFRQAEAIFLEAVQRPPSERTPLVERACAGDSELRAHVLGLLEHDASAHAALLSHVGSAVRGMSQALLVGGTEGAAHPARIGSYRIIRPLGEGGFGVVYLAEQESPRRTVALKLLRAPFASGSVARRFEYEGRVLARLAHPGIAQIYEAGVVSLQAPGAGGPALVRQPFLAIEYIDGRNLLAYGDGPGPGRAPLDTRARMELFAKVCDAVQYAHQRGVIHRDLKPDNILIAEEPVSATPGDAQRFGAAQPKILDFGVARVVDPDDDFSGTRTLPGQVVGTLAYMSPEQIVGDPALIDTRSDVYSLGVVLHQFLGGHPPYDLRGAAFDEVIRIVRERPPAPLIVADSRLRADAEAIVLKALDKDRDRRYQSAADLAADLRRALRGEPIEAKRDSGWYLARRLVRRHRTPLAIGVLFLLLLAGSSALGWSLYGAAERARARAADLLRLSSLQEARVIREGGGIGRRAAALAAVRKAAEVRVTIDLRDEAIACLALSDFLPEQEFPAGRLSTARGLRRLDRIAVSPGGGLVRVYSAGSGGVIAALAGPDVPVASMRFSQSGEFLGVFHDDGEGARVLCIWSVADAKPVLMRSGREAKPALEFGGEAGHPWVAIIASPGQVNILDLPSGLVRRTLAVRPGALWMASDPAGDRLALSGAAGTPLEVCRVSTGEVLLSIPSTSDLRSPTWSDDGRMLGAGGSDFLAYLWDAATGNLIRTLEGHRAPVSDVWLAAGPIIASGGWDGTARLWDAQIGREWLPPVRSEGVIGFDGDRIAVLSERTIRVFRRATDSPLAVLRAPGPLGPESTVEFSGDGRLLAVAGASGVHLWGLETGQTQALDERSARSIFFSEALESVGALVEGRLTLWPLADGRAGMPRVVWTGTQQAWASATSGGRSAVVCDAGTVVRIDLTSGQTSHLADGFRGMERPIVTPDQRWLFLGTWRGDPARVLSPGSGRTVLQFGGGSVRGAFSPDGARLAVSLPGIHRLYRVGDWRSHRTADWSEPDARVAGAAALSADGAWLAASTPPHTVRLADAHTGDTLATLPNPDRLGVTDLRFSPDARRLAITTLEREVLVWRLDELRASLRALDLDWK